MRPPGRLAIVAAALWSAPSSAAAQSYRAEGHVYVDRDGSGTFSAGDLPVAGVAVGFESRQFATTDGDGRFEFSELADAGQVWVRIPDGYSPAPVWAEVSETTAARSFDLALVPLEAPAPLSFVVISDSHIGKEEYGKQGQLDGDALRHSLLQALDLEPRPVFFALTGDITNRETSAELADAAKIVRDVGVPFVPVPGNHDWVDKGRGYRRVFGPPSYSFDAGGAHFLVLNDNPKTDADLEFVRRDIALSRPDQVQIAFLHRPPDDAVLDRLAEAGVDFLFTGHWHGNRYVERGGLMQFNTEPIIRGGLDFTPAGYRVVTVRDHSLSVVHGTVVERPFATFMWPPEEGCVPAGPLAVIAAVQRSAAPVRARVSLDQQAPVELSPAGGWDYVADLGPVSGEHTLTLEVIGGAAAPSRTTRRVTACASPPVPIALVDWPQHQGGPAHTGFAATPITPPLRAVWGRALGANLQGGAPVVAGGRVFVSLVDLGDGTRGGVVALDAATGETLWRYTTGHSVRNAVAVANDIAVIPSADGVLHAVSATTGDRRWTYDLGAGVDDNLAVLLAAPTIAEGTVYAGVLGRFVALDLATGAVRWQAKPAPHMKDFASRGAAAVAGDLVLAPFGLGGDGLPAWDRKTGRPRWRLGHPASVGVHAAPIADGDTIYVINSSTEVHAVDRTSGKARWKRQVHSDATPFSMASGTTPALADGRLFVPSQYESLVALDAATGERLWSAQVGVSPVHVAHNQRLARSIPGSPVVTGDVLWVGAGDGVLRAYRPDNGQRLWQMDLGAPILAGLAPAGDALLVTTFDGTVRALVHDPTGRLDPEPLPAAPPSGLFLGLTMVAFGLLVMGVMWRRR